MSIITAARGTPPASKFLISPLREPAAAFRPSPGGSVVVKTTTTTTACRAAGGSFSAQSTSTAAPLELLSGSFSAFSAAQDQSTGSFSSAARPQRKPAPVVLFGDSLTLGTIGGCPNHPYGKRLAELLAVEPSQVAVSGWAGERACDMGRRLQLLLNERRSCPPSHVVLLGGTNDLRSGVPAATVLWQLKSLYNMVRAAGCCCVAVTVPQCGPMDMTSFPVGPLRELVNSGIRAEVSAFQQGRGPALWLADFDAELSRLPKEDRNALFSDSCHFTPKGYDRLGECVFAALQAAGLSLEPAVPGSPPVPVTAPLTARSACAPIASSPMACSPVPSSPGGVPLLARHQEPRAVALGTQLLAKRPDASPIRAHQDQFRPEASPSLRQEAVPQPLPVPARPLGSVLISPVRREISPVRRLSSQQAGKKLVGSVLISTTITRRPLEGKQVEEPKAQKPTVLQTWLPAAKASLSIAPAQSPRSRPGTPKVPGGRGTSVAVSAKAEEKFSLPRTRRATITIHPPKPLAPALPAPGLLRVQRCGQQYIACY